jgi:hypothetical protein
MIKNFLLGFIIATITFYLAQGLYKKLTTHANVTKIPCQMEVVVFERLYEKSLLKELQNALRKGDYTLEVEIRKSRYMKTRLFKYVDKKELQNSIEHTFKKYKKELHVDVPSLHVNVLVYENDKLDPGKKTPKSKLYTGYLVFSFYNKNTLVYKVQIDFMQPHGEDIPKRIECGVESFMKYQGDK